MFKARNVEPKKQPLLANSPVTTIVSRQRLDNNVPAATDTHQQRGTLGMASSVRETVKKRGSWKTVGKEPPFREDLNAEAEESPLRETIPRKRLAMTQQAGKGLAGAVVNYELWRLAVEL
jgi:hypothetical protein